MTREARPPMLIDVDTGVDDAMALALAAELGVNVVGVSTVAGNVPVEIATRNTIDVLSYLDAAAVPVHRGASRPLVAPYKDATHVHGGNGLGGAQLPRATSEPAAMPGPAAIIRAAEKHAGQLIVVTLGPLTNLAIALNVRPEIAHQVSKVVVMGGAFFVEGNVTPHAEFNVYVDPDASSQVFNAGFANITLVGLDVTQQVALTRNVWERIDPSVQGSAGLLRQMLGRTFTERNMEGFFLHDPLALAVAIHPDLVEGETHHVSVTTGGAERGRTVAIPASSGPLVATSVNAERFHALLVRAFGLSGTATVANRAHVD